MKRKKEEEEEENEVEEETEVTEDEDNEEEEEEGPVLSLVDLLDQFTVTEKLKDANRYWHI